LGPNKLELIYQFFAGAISIFAGFLFFKFSISFLIVSSLFYFISRISIAPIFSAILLLLDFRFWEYSANVMRLGLAIAIFVFGFSFMNSEKYSIVALTRFFALITHISMLPITLIPREKKSMVMITLFFASIFSIWLVAPVWMPFVLNYVEVDSKFLYYYNSEYAGFQIPVHYIGIIATSLIFYNYSNSKIFIQISNILFCLLGVSAIFDLIGLSYRIAAIMLPFLVVSIPFQLNYFSMLFKSNRKIYYFTKFSTVLIFLYAFIKNFPLLKMHLE
jgi:hypothetical protein